MPPQPIGERVTALETEMSNVMDNQRVLFSQLNSFKTWLLISAVSAVGTLGCALGGIVLYKLGLLR